MTACIATADLPTPFLFKLAERLVTGTRKIQAAFLEQTLKHPQLVRMIKGVFEFPGTAVAHIVGKGKELAGEMFNVADGPAKPTSVIGRIVQQFKPSR